MSSDGGLLALREIERRLGIARRLAACIDDPRVPERIVHPLDGIMRFRMLMIAAGYEDGNDADSLRTDPMFKLAMARQPVHRDLCSQSTVSRTENLPDRRVLLRMGHAMVEHYCHSFRQTPQRIVLDIDDTYHVLHGDQQLRLKEFHDAAASWDRVERIIARVEAGPQDVDTRFIVTSIRGIRGRVVYQKLYCARGQAENHIKAWKTHLPADRTSCCRAAANQMRLFLHIGAYWLMWTLRAAMPRRSLWRTAQFDTLRLRLIKLAVRVVAQKRKVRLHLPHATPDQAIFSSALIRLPRMIV